jgi:hypothetical protein
LAAEAVALAVTAEPVAQVLLWVLRLGLALAAVVAVELLILIAGTVLTEVELVFLAKAQTVKAALARAVQVVLVRLT